MSLFNLRQLARLWRILLALIVSGAGLLDVVNLWAAPGAAQRPVPGSTPAQQLIRQWAGSEDTDALLRLPQVRTQLQRLLGTELPHLEHNLNVRGSVDVVSAALSLSGNAPHMGGEEEAVVCIATYNVEVSAAVFSQGAITAYSRDGQFDNLPRCIKDWITVVNSSSNARLGQPKNVRMAAIQPSGR